MKLLVDTHVILWIRYQPTKVPAAVRRVLSDREHQKLMSSASLAEIAVKVNVGKLQITDDFFDTVDSIGLDLLPFEARHAAALAALPLHHRDPFDRMLIAQAIADDATVVTVDERFRVYGVRTMP